MACMLTGPSLILLSLLSFACLMNFPSTKKKRIRGKWRYMAWLGGYGDGNGWDHKNLFLILTKEIKSTAWLEKVDKFTHLKKKHVQI